MDGFAELLLNCTHFVDALSVAGILSDGNVRLLEKAIESPDIVNYKLCISARETIRQIEAIDRRSDAVSAALMDAALLGPQARELMKVYAFLKKERIDHVQRLARLARELIKRSPSFTLSDTREQKARRQVIQEVVMAARSIRVRKALEELEQQAPLPLRDSNGNLIVVANQPVPRALEEWSREALENTLGWRMRLKMRKVEELNQAGGS